MINLYSTAVTAAANQLITWANKAVQRGNSATLAADSQTINLNVPGIYEVSVSGYGTTTAAGTFGLQLNANGAAVTRGAASMTTDAGEVGTAAFDALVVVNGVYDSTAKAALTVTYTGGAGTITEVGIVVKKVA